MMAMYAQQQQQLVQQQYQQQFVHQQQYQQNQLQVGAGQVLPPQPPLPPPLPALPEHQQSGGGDGRTEDVVTE
jgi:hypothetical protein